MKDRLGARLRAARWSAAALVAVLLEGSACGSPEPTSGAVAPEPVRSAVVIVVDTLRADHLGAYGYERPTSPAFDALAAESVLFRRAYATSSWTKPSTASILTGLHPGGHGADAIDKSLAAPVVTLGERLQAEGFTTIGIVSNPMLRHVNGFHQGWDVWNQEFARGNRFISTRPVVKFAGQRLRELAKSGDRFLLFVQLFDPHYDYRIHDDVDFATPGAGRLGVRGDIDRLRKLTDSLTDPELDFLRAAYDEEVWITDRGIKNVLYMLRETGLDDETVVVVTSDHGEEFRERGWIGHTRTLYDELVRVPLAIRVPPADPGASGDAGRVIDTPVSLTSIVPTLLDLLGVDREGERFDGPSLVETLRGGEAPEGPVYTEVEYRPWGRDDLTKWTVKRAVVEGRYKLVADESGELELYDLEADPSERENLAGELPELAARLADEAARTHAKTREGAPEADVRELSAEEQEQLRKLGYLGS